MMKRFLTLFALLFLVLGFRAEAALDILTATVTVTNESGTTEGDTLTVNGIVRTWRTTVVTPGSDIKATNNIGWAATNLFRSIAISPFPGLSLSMSGTNGVNLGAAPAGVLSVTLSAGWGSVVMTTNPLTSGTVVRVPYTLEGLPQQTNVASGVVNILSSDKVTNAIPFLAPAMRNFTNIGGGNFIVTTNGTGYTNTLNDPKVVRVSGTVGSLTNGGYLNPKLTNAINYGSAFRSPGLGTASEQFGLQATAGTNYDLSVGWDALSTNLFATAIGAASSATDIGATALGFGAQAASPASIAIGANTVVAATHTNSAAIGAGSASTAQHQIRLGTASESVSIPGSLQVDGSITNITAAGPANFPAGSDIAFGRFALTSLANGNNAAIPVGTNTFVEVSGPSAAFAINGIAGGRNGKFLILLNRTGYPMTLANQSGVDTTPANRIETPTGGDVALSGNSSVLMLYNPTALRWNIVSSGVGGGGGGSATNAIANTNGFSYGVLTVQAIVATNFYGDGSGLTNLNVVGASGIATNSGTGINNVLTNLVQWRTTGAGLVTVWTDASSGETVKFDSDTQPGWHYSGQVWASNFVGNSYLLTNINVANLSAGHKSTSNWWVGSFTGDGTGLSNVVSLKSSFADDVSTNKLPYTAITNAPWATAEAGVTKSLFSDDVSTNKLPYTAITNAPWLDSAGLLDSTNHPITINGTANRVTVSGSPVYLGGTVTLNGPQDLGTNSSPIFSGLKLSGLSPSKLVRTDGNTNVVSAAVGNGLAFDGTTLSAISTNSGDVFYVTNTYASNAYFTNAVISNVTVQEFHGKTTITSNLFATNIYTTNLYVSNIVTTNIIVQNFSGITNALDNLTVTNGVTNLAATASTMANWDGNKRLGSLANGGANTVLHGTTPPAYSAVVIGDISTPGILLTNGESQAVTFSNTVTGKKFVGTNFTGDAFGLTNGNPIFTGVYLAKRYGAIPDGVALDDVSITNGVAKIYSPSAAFTSADIGKSVVLYTNLAVAYAFTSTGSGVSISNTISDYLLTTVASVQDGTHLTLSSVSFTTLNPTRMIYGTDNTAAFQAAINDACVTNRGGVVQAESGLYVFSGALQNVSAQNSVLILPNSNANSTFVTLQGIGQFYGGYNGYNPTPVSKAGTILFCATKGTSGSPAFIGGNALTGFSGFNLVLKDLELRLAANASVGLVNIERGGGIVAQNVAFDSDFWGTWDQATYRAFGTNANAFGVIIPAQANNGINEFANCWFSGLSSAIIPRDHTRISESFFGVNNFALDCPSTGMLDVFGTSFIANRVALWGRAASSAINFSLNGVWFESNQTDVSNVYNGFIVCSTQTGQEPTILPLDLAGVIGTFWIQGQSFHPPTYTHSTMFRFYKDRPQYTDDPEIATFYPETNSTHFLSFINVNMKTNIQAGGFAVETDGTWKWFSGYNSGSANWVGPGWVFSENVAFSQPRVWFQDGCSNLALQVLTNTVASSVGFTGDGSGLTNVALGSLPATVVTNNGTLTIARVMLGNGARGLMVASASGAVPINANGSATTAAQVSALFPGIILTNGHSQAIALSNSVTIYGAMTNTGPFKTTTNYADAIYFSPYDAGLFRESSSYVGTLGSSVGLHGYNLKFDNTLLTGTATVIDSSKAAFLDKANVTNGISADGSHFTKPPTNTPTVNDVIMASSTAGDTKWAAPAGGSTTTNFDTLNVTNLQTWSGNKLPIAGGVQANGVGLTNTHAFNLQVFIDDSQAGGGITVTNVYVNSTGVGKSVRTVILQPGEWVIVGYTGSNLQLWQKPF